MAGTTGTRIYTTSRDTTLDLDSNVSLTFLHPRELAKTTNGSMLVLDIRYGDFSALLPGDIEADGERDMINWGVLQHDDVLQVAHHGSDTSTTDAFLEAVTPEVAVIPVGAGNEYGHPSPEVVSDSWTMARRSTGPTRTAASSSRQTGRPTPSQPSAVRHRRAYLLRGKSVPLSWYWTRSLSAS